MPTRTTRHAPRLLLATLLAVLAGPAPVAAMPSGEDSPAPAADMRPVGAPLGLVSRPPLDVVAQRFLKADLPETMAVVWADFDGTGKVLSARLIRGSGDASLDRALLKWARAMVVRTDRPGGGLLPVVLGADQSSPQAPQVLPPLGDEVVARAREAGMKRITGVLAFRNAASGTWSPRLQRSTGHAAVDEALVAWAMSLPPESLGAITPVYPVDESIDPDDRDQLLRMYRHLNAGRGE